MKGFQIATSILWCEELHCHYCKMDFADWAPYIFYCIFLCMAFVLTCLRMA